MFGFLSFFLIHLFIFTPLPLHLLTVFVLLLLVLNLDIFFKMRILNMFLKDHSSTPRIWALWHSGHMEASYHWKCAKKQNKNINRTLRHWETRLSGLIKPRLNSLALILSVMSGGNQTWSLELVILMEVSPISRAQPEWPPGSWSPLRPRPFSPDCSSIPGKRF